MDIKKLQTVVIEALEDVKAADIVLFDTSKLTSMFDRLIIASGTSNRQTKALAASVRDKVRQAGGVVVGMEGQDTGEWVLVDLGEMIVHIMQPPIRAYYQLEEIWGGKQIDLDKVKQPAKPKTTKRAVTAAKPAEKAAAPKKRATPAKKEPESVAKPKATSKKASASPKPAPAGKKTIKRPTAASQKTGTRKKSSE